MPQVEGTTRLASRAAFMDALTADGFVVLGGPFGEGDGDDSLLVVAATDETAIRTRLADDPWSGDLLTIKSIEAWSVWLGAPRLDRSCVLA